MKLTNFFFLALLASPINLFAQNTSYDICTTDAGYARDSCLQQVGISYAACGTETYNPNADCLAHLKEAQNLCQIQFQLDLQSCGPDTDTGITASLGLPPLFLLNADRQSTSQISFVSR